MTWKQSAALFSLSVLFNDGTSLVWSTDKVVSPTIRRGVNGMGMSGVVQSCLTFGIPVEYMQDIERRAATVGLSIYKDGYLVGIPQFYVDSRQLNDGIVNFTCYDRLAFADGYNITERDAEGITADYIDCDVAVGMIAQKLNISCDSMVFPSGKISRTAFVGRSFSQILTDISTANFGVFCVDMKDGADCLKFVPFYGALTNLEHIISDNYSEVKLSDPIRYGGYILTDSNKDEYTYNADSVDYVITVGADFYQPLTVASNLQNVISGYEYQPFTIDKAEVSGLLSINQIISVGDKMYKVNNIEFTADSSGMYARLMCNAATLNEIAPYCSRMQRAIDEAIKLGTGYGKNKEMRLTPYQGIIYVDTEVNK